ncbi:MAG: hypothetical protein ACOC97_01115 [Myxococcota bacterium]
MQSGRSASDWQAAKVADLDAELRGLGRGDGRLRLALGEALEAMRRTQGHHALGFSSIEAYARERCGLGPGVTRQLRTVARRLGALPRLREALEQGDVGFSMAELVARHATPDSEPFLVALARKTSVARMRKLFGLRKRERPTRRRLARTLDPDTAWLFEQTRMFVEAHCGSRSNDAVFEALLGEATTELLDHLKGEPQVDPIDEEDDPPPAADVPAGPMAAQQRPQRVEAPGTPPAPTDPTELDRRCVELARQLARRDLRVAEVTLDLKWLGGYGCPEAEYAERVLGMSHSALKAKHTLLRRLSRFPELQHALEDGVIGTEAAALVARVATQASVAAWLERATRRTVKHLKEEVRFVEMVANLTGDAPAGPPTEAQMARMHEVERGVLIGVLTPLEDNSQTSAPVQAPMEDDPTAVPPRKMGRVRRTFSMRRDLAREYLRLERGWEEAGRPLGDFVRFLSWSFWRAWGHVFEDDPIEYEHIYRRERHQCASPACERRDLTPHHLRFRRHGGGNEDENVGGLCTWCHLQGIHTWGSIKAEPPATQMIWKTPVLEVHGREVVWRREP